MKCFMTRGCRKWRNRFKIEKVLVLVEYLEQQTDWIRYKRKISKSRRSFFWRNQLYLIFLIKQMETMQKGAIKNEPRNLRTAVIFDSVEIVYNYGLNWGTVCRIFRFIYHFFLKLYIHCWIYFHSMVLESVGRDYCKKRVLEFLTEMFWLGCFSLFRGKSSTRMKNSCILNYNKGKANIWYIIVRKSKNAICNNKFSMQD